VFTRKLFPVARGPKRKKDFLASKSGSERRRWKFGIAIVDYTDNQQLRR
jgi:hypothetical protein